MEPLHAFRDDGPLAEILSRALPAAPGGPTGLLVFGTLPLAIALATTEHPGPAVNAAVGWLVLVGCATLARGFRGRIDWLFPAVLRASEYGFVIWMTLRFDPGALPAAFAMLFAASIHHYESVYRIRHLDVAPPRWVGWMGGGWEGRIVLVAVLGHTSALATAMTTVAAFAGAVSVTESALVWVRRARVHGARV